MGSGHIDLERLQDAAAAKQAAHREALLAGSVSLVEGAELTGVSVDRLRRLIARGDLLAFSAEGQLCLPRWQLQRSEVAPALSGAIELAAVFPGDLADLGDWVQRSNTELDGRSPAVALRQGDVSRVLVSARAIGAAGR